MPIALTRPVSDSLGQCELTHLARTPIDVQRARRQHHAYEQALADLGCRIERLPAQHDLPDAVFEADALALLDDVGRLVSGRVEVGGRLEADGAARGGQSARDGASGRGGRLLAGRQPELALGAANRRILADASAALFVTVFYGILEPTNGRLTFANAGHNPPLLIRSEGPVESLHAGGMVLGLFEGVPYEAGRVEMRPGDTLLAYSDGVTESANPTNGLFGEGRLCRALEEQRRLSLDNSLADLLKQLDAWRRGAPPRDDISLLACQIPK